MHREKGTEREGVWGRPEGEVTMGRCRQRDTEMESPKERRKRGTEREAAKKWRCQRGIARGVPKERRLQKDIEGEAVWKG